MTRVVEILLHERQGPINPKEPTLSQPSDTSHQGISNHSIHLVFTEYSSSTSRKGLNNGMQF